MRMHKQMVKKKQVEVGIRLKITSIGTQCCITTQHINEGAPKVLARKKFEKKI
jgi:hypothetical protein